MIITNGNFKIYSWILASIWSREPIIISSPSNEALEDFLTDLFHFFPQYRQTVACGELPKKIYNLRSRLKLIEEIDCVILKETIITAFQEEENCPGVPLQLLCFNVDSNVFATVLIHLNRGWLATTRLPPPALKLFFHEMSFEVIKFNSCSIIFLKGHHQRVPIEANLIKSYLMRSELAASYLIQKKMSDIRYAAEVLINEIEQGKKFYQAEIQEIFKLTAWDFEKCLDIMQAEFYLDSRRYVRHTPNKIKQIHKELMRLNGILYVCSFYGNKLIGLTRSKEIEILPLKTFREFPEHLEKMMALIQIGPIERMTIEFCRKTKLVFYVFQNHSRADKPVIFGFFLKPNVTVGAFLKGLELVFERELTFKM